MTFKQVVNEALRKGLTRMTSKPAFRTIPVDLGNCHYPNRDKVWEILEEVEPIRSGR